MLLLGLFLWTIFSGALFVFGLCLLLLLAVISIGYTDTAILFFLGAREVRSSDEKLFFEAAAQSAYKLAVRDPHLYLYNGSLERAFVLQHHSTVSLVLNRSLLEHIQPSELSAICFELLLQVKKGMAPKRTKVMFLLGALSWLIHALVGLASALIPVKEVRQSANALANYFLHPVLDLLFKLNLGKGYFSKFQTQLEEYPAEREAIERFAMKLKPPFEVYSLPSRKMLEVSSSMRSKHFQNILSLEILPHEWDFINQTQDSSAQKA